MGLGAALNIAGNALNVFSTGVQVTGQNQHGNYLIGEKLANQFRHIPGAVDVHVQQAFDNPTLFMEIACSAWAGWVRRNRILVSTRTLI